MTKFNKLLCLCLTLPLSLGTFACAGNGGDGGTPQKQLAPQEEWIEATEWGNDLRKAYLKPYWYTREIYNETGAIIGADGEVELMYTPTEIHSIRSYDLKTTYTEGVDYTVEGKKIKRIPTGSLPYWKIEEYYRETPDPDLRNQYGSVLPIAIDKYTIESEYKDLLAGERYLEYSDNNSFITSKQIAVTYRHNDIYSFDYPKAQQDKLQHVLSKINQHQDVNVAVYGDSVSVGCNASGTSYGGNITPHMPHAWDMVKEWVEDKYDINFNVDIKGEGGWQISDCLNNYDRRLSGKQGGYDLMILRIGGNDGGTSEILYKGQLRGLLDAFFTEYKDASVIIVSPEQPNSQAAGWTGNVPYIEGYEEDLIESYGGNVALAKVQTFSWWTTRNGKKERDWLANNINHSNDFMIRSYAQIILKTMFGNEYVNEYAPY